MRINPCPAETGFNLSFFENTVYPDKLASDEAILSRSTLF